MSSSGNPVTYHGPEHAGHLLRRRQPVVADPTRSATATITVKRGDRDGHSLGGHARGRRHTQQFTATVSGIQSMAVTLDRLGRHARQRERESGHLHGPRRQLARYTVTAHQRGGRFEIGEPRRSPSSQPSRSSRATRGLPRSSASSSSRRRPWATSEVSLTSCNRNPGAPRNRSSVDLQRRSPAEPRVRERIDHHAASLRPLCRAFSNSARHPASVRRHSSARPCPFDLNDSALRGPGRNLRSPEHSHRPGTRELSRVRLLRDEIRHRAGSDRRHGRRDSLGRHREFIHRRYHQPVLFENGGFVIGSSFSTLHDTHRTRRERDDLVNPRSERGLLPPQHRPREARSARRGRDAHQCRGRGAGYWRLPAFVFHTWDLAAPCSPTT